MYPSEVSFSKGWRRQPMRGHGLDAVFATIVLVALGAGCAAPTPGRPVTALAASAGDLSGTWTGQFWIIGGFYYPNEGTILLHIKRDGTYTVRMTPTPAANNI